MADYLDYLRGYGPRQDSAYTGLNPDFAQRLAAMIQAAPTDARISNLLTHLYRSDQDQAAAIRSVARNLGMQFTPDMLQRGIAGYAARVGGSQHQTGYAADLNLDALSPAARQWYVTSAPNYGLRFPNSRDPGHIEYNHGWEGSLPAAQPSYAPTSPGFGIASIMPSALATAPQPAPQQTPRPELPPIFGMAGFKDGGRVLHGLDINVQKRKSDVRSGIGKDGKPWSVSMPCSYGEIKRTKAADGDRVDCYIGPDSNSGKVWIVDQIDARTGKYDEAKVLLNFDSKQAALGAYQKAFSDGRGKDRIGSVTEMSVGEFKDWIASSRDTKKPVGDLRKNFAHGGMVGMADGGRPRAPSEAMVLNHLFSGPRSGEQTDQVLQNWARPFASLGTMPNSMIAPDYISQVMQQYQVPPEALTRDAVRRYIGPRLNQPPVPPRHPSTVADVEYARGGTVRGYETGGAPVGEFANTAEDAAAIDNAVARRQRMLDIGGPDPNLPWLAFNRQALGNFGTRAVNMIPGVHAATSAYNAYQQGRPVAAGMHGVQGATEVALPFIMGPVARAYRAHVAAENAALNRGTREIIEEFPSLGRYPDGTRIPAPGTPEYDAISAGSGIIPRSIEGPNFAGGLLGSFIAPLRPSPSTIGSAPPLPPRLSPAEIRALLGSRATVEGVSPRAAAPRNEPPNPAGLTPRQRALDMFNHMDPPPRREMHASGGRVGYEGGGDVDGDLIPGGRLPPLPEPRETELDRYHARQAELERAAREAEQARISPWGIPTMMPTPVETLGPGPRMTALRPTPPMTLDPADYTRATALSLIDPMGLPSHFVGTVAPEVRDRWRAGYEGRPEANVAAGLLTPWGMVARPATALGNAALRFPRTSVAGITLGTAADADIPAEAGVDAPLAGPRERSVGTEIWDALRGYLNPSAQQDESQRPLTLDEFMQARRRVQPRTEAEFIEQQLAQTRQSTAYLEATPAQQRNMLAAAARTARETLFPAYTRSVEGENVALRNQYTAYQNGWNQRRAEQLDRPFVDRHPNIALGLTVAPPLLGGYNVHRAFNRVDRQLVDAAAAANTALSRGDFRDAAVAALNAERLANRALPRKAASIALNSVMPVEARLSADFIDRYSLPPDAGARQAAERRLADVPGYIRDSGMNLATGVVSSLTGAGLGMFGPNSTGGAQARTAATHLRGIDRDLSPDQMAALMAERASRVPRANAATPTPNPASDLAPTPQASPQTTPPPPVVETPSPPPVIPIRERDPRGHSIFRNPPGTPEGGRYTAAPEHIAPAPPGRRRNGRRRNDTIPPPEEASATPAPAAPAAPAPRNTFQEGNDLAEESLTRNGRLRTNERYGGGVNGRAGFADGGVPDRLSMLATQASNLRPPPPRPPEPREMGPRWRLPFWRGGKAKGYETGGTPTTPPAASDPSTLDWMRQALRERALNGPGGYEMLSQVSMLPIGGSRTGAGLARDFSLARTYWDRAMRERPYAGTGDITGGSPHPSLWSAMMDRHNQGPMAQYAPVAESSTGLAIRPGVRAAELPDQMMIFPETLSGQTPWPPYRPHSGLRWPDNIPPPANTNVPPLGRSHGGNVQHGHEQVAVGPIMGPTGGRDDAKPISVPSGSFVVSADVVSALGGGNTGAGMEKLDKVFGGSRANHHYAGGGSAGNNVGIRISDGEYVIPPEAVARVGSGDMAAGHRALDKLMLKLRAENVRTLRSLPPPAKS